MTVLLEEKEKLNTFIKAGKLACCVQALSDYLTDYVFVLTDDNVKSLYSPILEKSLSDVGKTFYTFSFPAGEASKQMSVVDEIVHVLLTHQFPRQTTILSLGGGVVTDIGGFVASIYQRGVNLVHVPTTLLAQIDAAIGGKTGVNHALGKNMLGSFYFPSAIFMDVAVLKTLPRRHYNAAIAEIVKYALLTDQLDQLEIDFDLLLSRDLETLKKIIFNCYHVKMNIVTQDCYDCGKRQMLNLGHTLAHAIEVASHFHYLHGEAVAYGLCVALSVSKQYYNLDEGYCYRACELLKRAALLELPLTLSADTLKDYLVRDKKNRYQDELTMVLLADKGKPVLHQVQLSIFFDTLTTILNYDKKPTFT